MQKTYFDKGKITSKERIGHCIDNFKSKILKRIYQFGGNCQTTGLAIHSLLCSMPIIIQLVSSIFICQPLLPPSSSCFQYPEKRKNSKFCGNSAIVVQRENFLFSSCVFLGPLGPLVVALSVCKYEISQSIEHWPRSSASHWPTDLSFSLP